MSKVYANFSKAVRPVGMMHGMNNGPYMHQGNFAPEFAEMGVPFVRFHETHSKTTKCIEIPHIFRDWDADENDEKNYFFDVTDKVVAEAVNHGITVMYRLGMGTEFDKPLLFCTMPEDPQKWARICVNIIRHYTDGWANGFYYDIPYWEIWNEPDLPLYWEGDRERFFKLYEAASTAIREFNPRLKVGGPAICWPLRDDNWPEDFLKFVVEKKLPLDFYSWHFYTAKLDKIENVCSRVDEQLKEAGLYGKIESINSEWHAVSLEPRPNPRFQNIAGGGWDLSPTGNICTAVSNVAAMIIMQRHNVTKAAYYDAENRGALCGLWGVHMNKQPQFYGFKAFNYLYQAGTECESSSEELTMQVMAARDEKKGYLLVTNYAEEEKTVTLELTGIPGADMQMYLLDETRNLDLVDTDSFGAAACVNKEIALPKMSVALVELLFR